MTVILIVLIGIIAYVYVGYPAALLVLGLVRPRPVRKADIRPSVSVLIAARNEAQCIGDTLANKLALDYPRDKLEIIVVSDCSDDGTDDIVQQYAHENVVLLRQDPQEGKTAALNRAALHATGDILVFSDANSMYAPDSLKCLVASFADPEVGYVTGKMVYVTRRPSGVSEGCSTYMKYENMLRTLETRVGSVVGVDGGIDACRRDVYTRMDPSLLPDFVLPLNVVEQGFRVVYEPHALLREETLEYARGEYSMRVRVSLRAFHGMMYKRNLFNPIRYGVFSIQLISHKLLRYLVGFVLLLTFIVSAIMVREKWIQVFLAVQIVCYILALCGWYASVKARPLKLFYIPFYFCLVNVAAVEAFLRFLKGERQVMWKPREGAAGP